MKFKCFVSRGQIISMKERPRLSMGAPAMFSPSSVVIAKPRQMNASSITQAIA